MDDRAAKAQDLVVLVVLSFSVYWLLEWTFLMTRLSFLGNLGFTTSISVLASSAVLVVVPLLPVSLGCAALWILPPALRQPMTWSILCIPVAIQTLVVLLLVDNFTYTMLSFGIKHAKGWIWLYRLGLVAVFAYLFFRNTQWLSSSKARRALWSTAAAGIVLISLAGTALKIAFSSEPQRFELVEPKRRPNIIFLASDGLSAKRLGVYGAERNTSPFLEQFKNRTLFFSNAFSNAASSFPSIISMLSGRSLFTTKTFSRYEPLRSADAERHLPAILNQLGYSGIQIGDRMYVNSLQQNMRNSFSETFFVDISWIPSGLYHDVLFDLRLFERAVLPAQRLLGDGYRMVARIIRSRARASAPSGVSEVRSARRASDNASALGDQPRIDLFLRTLEKLPEPFYAHLHLAETHVALWASDEHFDDTIEASDAYFEQIVSWLEERGKLDNSVIIISSDHSRRRGLYERVPLMIYFPDTEHRGVVDTNVQLLDIAPTVLSYLGQPIPDWMEGDSLLGPEVLPADRLVFGYYDRPVRAEPPSGESGSDEEYVAPLGVISLIQCDQWFYYSIVQARMLRQGRVAGDRPDCQDVRPITESEAQNSIERYLEERDVTADDMPPPSTKLL